MKLVMFGIDYQKNLIIQFPVFVQPYMQTKLTLYQVEIWYQYQFWMLVTKFNPIHNLK